MREEDQQAIDDLFERLRRVETELGPRDPEAEGRIRHAVSQQPAAPYYMAQTIVAQGAALADAEQRISALETRLREESSGVFAALFGRDPAADASATGRPGALRPGESDGFLAGAAQTAFGVAGGMILANIVADTLFGTLDADAAETVDETDAGSTGDIDTGDFDIGF
ncbi:DUF2076 domain-containing protein [Bauldia litoralis]|uniref:DUF2076 domain-containing protein n=1 Tax=Bauldia litoralis TaxID=665467 RepID=UPI003266DED0